MPNTITDVTTDIELVSLSLRSANTYRQATLGHSSITTTEKYLYISPSESSSLFIKYL